MAKPTIFIAVPRIYQRIQEEIVNEISKFTWFYQLLFYIALYVQALNVRSHTRSWYWDRVFFNTIQSIFGGCIKVFGVGGAPMNPLLAEFLTTIFNVPVIEGYGLTECCSTSNIVLNTGHYVYKNVGPPLCAAEIKLIDCPDMNYFTSDMPCPRGEVLIRGGILFSGYYKQPEETKAAIDSEGWYHTGDIAVLLPNYAVKIVDRKKNFFKLSQGEYVAAEKLEMIYSKSKFVSQVFVYGDSTRNFLIAIVVPDKHAVLDWYKQKFNKDGKFKEICDMPELKQAIQADFNAIQKKNKLRGIEKIRDLIIDSEQWTVENDLLTPTFKLKRKAVQNKYSALIDSTYKKNA